MKKNAIKKWLMMVCLAVVLTACEVEFSPNAAWKEIPVVYCLIDQDDDTTWARVEKCYLGDSDIYSYSSISDSFNYAPGAINVSLIGFRGSEMVDSLPFEETLVDREEGNFANRGQMMYYCPTKNRFNERLTYEIRVRRTADGKVIARSEKPIPLIVRRPDDSVITKPTYTTYPYKTGMFSFKGPGRVCQIEWNTMENARRYQPIIRLYYSVDGDTTYVDVKCQSVSGVGEETRKSINYSNTSFLSSVKTQLQADPRSKKYLKMVDIYLTACSEDLSAYLTSVEEVGTIDQGREAYSNIEGGRGVFGARRTHLHKWLPADSSINSSSPVGLHYQLKQLGVGF